jgi:hypothetical protein
MRWNASDRFEPAPRTVEVDWPDLHICPSCDRPFVVPTSVFDVVAPGRYLVDLRCMNCDWAKVSAASKQRLEDLERELQRQLAAMHEIAELMELTRQIDEVDAFARALQDNLILPEDF